MYIQIQSNTSQLVSFYITARVRVAGAPVEVGPPVCRAGSVTACHTCLTRHPVRQEACDGSPPESRFPAVCRVRRSDDARADSARGDSLACQRRFQKLTTRAAAASGAPVSGPPRRPGHWT